LFYFLAVLEIDKEIGCLRTVKNYSYILASVVYYIQVLSVEKLLPAVGREALTDEDANRARERFLEKR
jgi:hypothetical protein